MGVNFDPQQTITTAEAIAIFDQLEPVDTEFMIGEWKGAGVNTNHPLDGLLELACWHGKFFKSREEVYPLVHTTLSQKKFWIQPALMPMNFLMRFPGIKKLVSKRLFLMFRFMLSTNHSSARLRMTEFRGKSSATMIYDRKPINDVFRKLDDNTVLGVMDLKGMDRYFFFTLMRE